MRTRIIYLITIVAGGWLTGCAAPTPRQCDVLVYGGTAGGTIAAIAAANEGLSVVLLEPRRHIGGMVSGGLGQTDHGNKSVIGGMSLEFFARVGQHYNEPVSWYFEPRVAEKVFREWLIEARVEVVLDSRLSEVVKHGARITRIVVENGTAYTAPVFIDASYEGDLMARAAVSYAVGREGRDVYAESLAGRIEHSKYHQFDVEVSPYDAAGKLLPCIFDGHPTEVGKGDPKVQAYNFRVCMCSRKENQVPFPKPPGYDPYRYELLKRYLAKKPDLKLANIMSIGRMPNDKTDVNNNGAFSTDHIGGSWDYPDANYARRQEIWDDHVSYVQGFFYFLANDPSVPARLQEEINGWGLAKDEFIDTGHWPHQLYIREARRMIGTYVMHQADLQTERTKPDSIGMGSYNSDSHHVQRLPTSDGAVLNEGDMQVPVRPYEIAYRALTPKIGECENLLVPVCFSASHVAYSSMRMEPQYMIMGHAAGLAASYAVRNHAAVQQIDVPWLQERLREHNQVLSLAGAAHQNIQAQSLPGVVVDNLAAVLNGDWRTSTSIPPFVGVDYLHDDNNHKGVCTARFVPRLAADGEYEVRVSYTANPNRATNVPVVIAGADGRQSVKLDQRAKPSHAPFASLGKFRFRAGMDHYVEIQTANTDGYVVVDAVQWVPIEK